MDGGTICLLEIGGGLVEVYVFCRENHTSDTALSQMWWYPPILQLKNNQPKPAAESYVLRHICIWMPRRVHLDAQEGLGC